MTPHYDADMVAEDKDQNYTAALLHIASDADYCHGCSVVSVPECLLDITVSPTKWLNQLRYYLARGLGLGKGTMY